MRLVGRTRNFIQIIAFITIGMCIILLCYKKGGAVESTKTMGEDKINSEVITFLKGISSEDCGVREGAIYSFIPKAANRKSIHIYKVILEKKLIEEKNDTLKVKIRLVLDHLKNVILLDKTYEEIIAIYKKAVKQPTDAEITKALNKAQRTWISMLLNNNKCFHDRFAVLGWMVHLVEHEYPGFPSDNFFNAMEHLLNYRDETVRIMVASQIALRLENRIKDKNKYIGILIKGLENQEFLLRYISQEALKKLTNQDICVDPSDSGPASERLVKQWLDWWGQ